MNDSSCAYCGEKKKAYFAQVNSNGVQVVAQRCAACNRSTVGQPFVAKFGFSWNSLPKLGDEPPVELPGLIQDAVDHLKDQETHKRRPQKGEADWKPAELPTGHVDWAKVWKR